MAQKVDQVVKEAGQLQQIGRESVGRDRLQQALTKAEVELRSIESRQQISQTQPVQSERTAQDRDAIKQIQNLIKTEPDTTKMAQKVQDFITNNKSIDPETAQNLDRLAKQAHQLDHSWSPTSNEYAAASRINFTTRIRAGFKLKCETEQIFNRTKQKQPMLQVSL